MRRVFDFVLFPRGGRLGFLQGTRRELRIKLIEVIESVGDFEKVLQALIISGILNEQGANKLRRLNKEKNK